MMRGCVARSLANRQSIFFLCCPPFPAPSQTITAGTTFISLGGNIGFGNQVPPVGETVSIAINGAIANATIGVNGGFSTSFDTHAIPTSSTPNPITYTYAGDVSHEPTTNSLTTLTVNPVRSVSTMAVAVQGTCALNQSFVVLATAGPSGTLTPTGFVTFKRTGPMGSVFDLGSALLVKGVSRVPAQIAKAGSNTFTASYGGDENFELSTGTVTVDCSATPAATTTTVTRAPALWTIRY